MEIENKGSAGGLIFGVSLPPLQPIPALLLPGSNISQAGSGPVWCSQQSQPKALPLPGAGGASPAQGSLQSTFVSPIKLVQRENLLC